MVITELRRTGTGAFEDTPVVFRWSGAEHSSNQDELSLHLQVKHVRKEIPGGNGEVVHQTMSVTWQPFELVGEWRDTWGNRTQPGGLARTGSFALTMFDEFSAMVGRVPDVRVELDALSFVGLLTDLKLKYRHKGHIRWSATLSPTSNERVQPQRIRAPGQSVQKWISDAAQRGAELNEAFRSMLSGVTLSGPDHDLFTGLMLGINDAIDRLQRVSTEGFGTNAEQKLLLVAATMRRLRGASLTMCLALSKMSTPLRVAYDDALMAATHREWVASSIVMGYHMIGLSQEAEVDMTRAAGQRPRRIYYPRRGQSIEKISAEVYGDAGNWRRIYDANHLSSLILNGDEELFIPEEAR
jgi:hypothetical protein